MSSPAERIYGFFFLYSPFFLRSYRRPSSRIRLLLLRPYTPFRHVRGVFPEVIYSALRPHPTPFPATPPHRKPFARSDTPIPGHLHWWRCSTVCCGRGERKDALKYSGQIKRHELVCVNARRTVEKRGRRRRDRCGITFSSLASSLHNFCPRAPPHNDCKVIVGAPKT